jgi:hypothetical protein
MRHHQNEFVLRFVTSGSQIAHTMLRPLETLSDWFIIHRRRKSCLAGPDHKTEGPSVFEIVSANEFGVSIPTKLEQKEKSRWRQYK